MDGEARRFEIRLRETFSDPRLVVRWNRDLERYEVGYRAQNGVEWILVVQDPNTRAFRPLDQRTVEKLQAMDKAVIPVPTPEEYRQMLLDEKERVKHERLCEKAYRVKHEAKFFGGRFWNQRLSSDAR